MRLCVETYYSGVDGYGYDVQPPSCGCVLKRKISLLALLLPVAAAFVRLCVETICLRNQLGSASAAAFVRLCVETNVNWADVASITGQPPSCGCVLKLPS